MEENKNCCENKTNGKGCCCEISKYCAWTKCRGMKYLIAIIIIIIVFCLGTQLGELKSHKRCTYDRGGMMNWNYKNVKCLTGDETPKTPTPPVVTQ